jgi:hypothetical protein
MSACGVLLLLLLAPSLSGAQLTHTHTAATHQLGAALLQVALALACLGLQQVRLLALQRGAIRPAVRRHVGWHRCCGGC